MRAWPKEGTNQLGHARRQDAAPPRITGLGGPAPKVEQQPPVTNHNFVSEDNQWKLNLTKDFIALSTLHYSGWEEFARQLDKPLAAFIRLLALPAEVAH